MSERRTPLYEIHLRTASKMVKGGGDYMFPLSYTSPLEEHINTRTNVGMQDLSTMGEVDIKGPGAERLINRLLVNEIRDMHPGQVRYSSMCNEEGGIMDDITVYKFGDEHFMIVTSSGPRLKSAEWISEHASGMSAYVTDQSGSIALISVQGPRSRDFLLNITTRSRPGKPEIFLVQSRPHQRYPRADFPQRLHRRTWLRALYPGRGSRRDVGIPAAERSRVRDSALRRGRHAEPAHRKSPPSLRPGHR